MATRQPFASQPVSRRQLTLGAALAGIALATPRLGPALAASQADLASFGFPTIDVTVTADGYEGVPATLEAGRYLVNATIDPALEANGGGGIGFILPYNMSAADFLAATAPSAEASPAADDGGAQMLPDVAYQSVWSGGPYGTSGTASAVIDLTEGEWLAWGNDPAAPQAPVVVTVTGEFPADVAAPDSDIAFTFVDFGITVEGNLTAGDHIVMIENTGAEPHFIDLALVPDGTTNDDLTSLIEGSMAGTPPTTDFNFERDITPVAFTPPSPSAP